MTADEGLTLGVMADLGRTALGVRSAEIERVTLPVRNTKGSDGRAYVVPTDDAAAVLEAFRTADPFP